MSQISCNCEKKWLMYFPLPQKEPLRSECVNNRNEAQRQNIWEVYRGALNTQVNNNNILE